MPFDPKLILPDEPPLTPEGELQLPCELAALAEQLGDDARHLATCYPASREAAAVLHAPRGLPRRQFAGFVATIGATLATLLLAFIVFSQFANERTGGRNAAGSHDGTSLRREFPPTTQTVFPAASPAINLSLPSGGAAVSLTELSGPELEAVFDLWQRPGDDDTRASIAF